MGDEGLMEPRAAADSRTVTHHLVLPSDSNSLGGAFGGQVLSWIDICAAICAQRHTRRQVVTASIDEVHFHAPLRVGMTGVVSAQVSAAFRHSVEVAVEVWAENPVSGYRKQCCTALLTFTALDEDFKASPVPPLDLKTEEDRKRQTNGEERRKRRLENRKAMRS